MTGAKRKKNSVVWRKINSFHCADIKQWCLRRLPILEWAPCYNLKENLIPDTVSGIMLAVQQVTQGLAFAILSSVHPVFGLYGSLFPAIIYAIFGMGRHVATGTFALTSLISANAVERLVPQASQNFTTYSNSGVLGLSDFEMQRIGVAAAVSFLGGIIQIYAYVFENIKSVQLEALLLSLLSIVVLVLVKELNEQFKRKIKVVLPVDLVLIIAASFACYCANMEYTYGLDVVGHIPDGIPSPRAPPMNILSEVVTEAFGVALVGYVASLALAQGSAKKFKYSVDDNQEFLAHGLSNVIPSFFFCIPSAAAMGRTAGLYSTGSKTQVACLISCILVLIVIYAVGPLLYWLPMCVLASVIVVGLKGMLIQFRDLKKYWNVDKIDWGIWVSTYIFTICFAANVGLLFGVVCTIAVVIVRFPRAKTLSLKNMKELEYKVKTEVEGENLQQVKFISINNPLVFLNAKKFHADLMNTIQKDNANNQPPDDINKCEQNMLLNLTSNGTCNGETPQPYPNEKCSVILDCTGLTFFDYTGVSTLVQAYTDCKSQNVDFLLANCTASLKKAVQYCGHLESDKHIFFESVSAAIGAIHLNKNLSKCSDHSEV
ncbi:anion exchange transporter isoform X5 [Trichosurus vulpecula]|uniref:anion exchange transporter isoform X5 n=1 Tax=Trichosurus vulpecula TaxID=9337 RepID=UPI00186B20FF|nr:anion exchange transporter isoform X5 [Trichosurus vulpecula]